jgi:hypothetical protein
MSRQARLYFLRASALSAFAIAVLGQQAFADGARVSTGEPVYQGTAFITAVTSSCTANSINVGDYYTILYRQLPESGNTVYGGGIAFFGSRSALSYVLPANTALNGGQQKVNSVTVYGQSSKVGPATRTATTPSVQINGTVGSFFNYTGCTITVRSSLALRP